MNRFKRFVSGNHTPGEIRCHLALLAIVFWALIACARLGYPAENAYSIHRETFSAMGSFEHGNNPHWFWVFSIAMIYCGALLMPVVRYIHRRIRAISRVGAGIGAFFFYLGSLGMIVVGLFPYAHATIIGDWKWEHFHMVGASFLIIGFVPGILIHGGLVLKDALTQKKLSTGKDSPYRRLIGPFLLCAPVMGFVAYNIHWASVFAAIKALVVASGHGFVHDITHAMYRFGGIPILEHVAIWSLTIFIIWFTMMLPGRIAQTTSGETLELSE